MQVKDFIKIIQALAPADLAMDWDNCGLQAGRASATVHKAAFALDATLEAVELAMVQGCDLLAVHHPLLFRPVKKLDFDSPLGEIIGLAAQGRLSIVAAHTNWDAAGQGVARTLADILEIDRGRPLETIFREPLKLVVFVPQGHEEAVREALFAVGAGTIGAYDRCSFEGPGQGGFRSPAGSRPFVGRPGEDKKVSEARLEVILPAHLAEAASAAVRRTHPYEEPAFEFHKVRVQGLGQGLGYIGEWDPPRDLLPHCLKKLGLAVAKWAGARPGPVSRVAILPGAGGDYIAMAKAAGAQALITGDVKYSQALEARALGLTVVDLGHFETEWPGLVRLKELVARDPAVAAAGVECLLLDQGPVWNFFPAPASKRPGP